MFLRAARCGSCEKHLPTGPGFLGFRLAPYELKCEHCGAVMKIGFSHRATWLSWLVWKVAFIIIAISFFPIVMMNEWPLRQVIIVWAIGAFFGGLFGGYIICLILPLFLQPLFDIIHALIVLIRGKNDGMKAEDQPDSVSNLPPPSE